MADDSLKAVGANGDVIIAPIFQMRKNRLRVRLAQVHMAHKCTAETWVQVFCFLG